MKIASYQHMFQLQAIRNLQANPTSNSSSFDSIFSTFIEDEMQKNMAQLITNLSSANHINLNHNPLVANIKSTTDVSPPSLVETGSLPTTLPISLNSSISFVYFLGFND